MPLQLQEAKLLEVPSLLFTSRSDCFNPWVAETRLASCFSHWLVTVKHHWVIMLLLLISSRLLWDREAQWVSDTEDVRRHHWKPGGSLKIWSSARVETGNRKQWGAVHAIRPGQSEVCPLLQPELPEVRVQTGSPDKQCRWVPVTQSHCDTSHKKLLLTFSWRSSGGHVQKLDGFKHFSMSLWPFRFGWFSRFPYIETVFFRFELIASFLLFYGDCRTVKSLVIVMVAALIFLIKVSCLDFGRSFNDMF